ncbi:hypothetical protein [Pelagibacterium montanilacus]|uniref:hypothetical protein n=1 Tax=Pelagibacterium montanilacus TaxID=2185280 RepID=UPI0013E0D43C|nr:hypothetical protein [Pelagibacterium montanilacus]
MDRPHALSVQSVDAPGVGPTLPCCMSREGNEMPGLALVHRRREALGYLDKRCFHMLKFIGGTVGVIFLIGLLVVIGLFSLIF